jgi:hypothetical protein
VASFFGQIASVSSSKAAATRRRSWRASTPSSYEEREHVAENDREDEAATDQDRPSEEDLQRHQHQGEDDQAAEPSQHERQTCANRTLWVPDIRSWAADQARCDASGTVALIDPTSDQAIQNTTHKTTARPRKPPSDSHDSVSGTHRLTPVEFELVFQPQATAA